MQGWPWVVTCVWRNSITCCLICLWIRIHKRSRHGCQSEIRRILYLTDQGIVREDVLGDQNIESRLLTVCEKSSVLKALQDAGERRLAKFSCKGHPVKNFHFAGYLSYLAMINPAFVTEIATDNMCMNGHGCIAIKLCKVGSRSDLAWGPEFTDPWWRGQVRSPEFQFQGWH